MASQNYPFPNSFPTFYTDLGVNAQNPAIGYGGTETGALYFEDREVNGVMYRVQNATWNKVAQKWLLVDNTKAAYAFTFGTGVVQILNSPAGVSPFTVWTQLSTFSSPGTYNVVSYGAKGNGTVDDSVAIQAAINAAIAAGGGVVYLPPGTYLISNQGLKLGSNISLVGSGIGISTLKLGSASINGIIYDTVAYANCSVSSVSFDCNATIGNAIQLSATGHDKLTIERCEFKNAGGGNIWAVRIGAVTTTTATSTRVTFRNNIVAANSSGTLENVLFASIENSTITGNWFTGSTSTSAALAIYGYCKNSSLLGNVFANNANGDYYIQQGQHITCAGNVHVGNGSGTIPVKVINCQDILITGNDFQGTSNASDSGVWIFDYNAANFDGVHASIFPNSNRIVIQSNKFDNVYNGVYFPAQTQADKNLAQTNITIENNVFSRTNNASVYLNGGTATGIIGVRIVNNVVENGSWTSTGAFEILGSATNTTDILIANNRVGSSSGGASSAIHIDKATDVRLIANDVHANATPLSLTNAGAASVAVDNVGINTGSGVPTSTLPKGSLFQRSDGAAGSTLYVTQGGGTWNAVAGV